MTPIEIIRHYFHRVIAFENKRQFMVGRYSFSECLFILTVGFWFAYFLPQILMGNLLLAAQGITALLVLWWVLMFVMAGGLGRVVDVI